MRNIIYIISFLFTSAGAFAQKKIIVHFEHYANGKPIVLNDSIYKNDPGENYTVTKLKYYVSNLHFITNKKTVAKPSVYLIDASGENDIGLVLPAAEVSGIEFLLGVDSILNCSGAQEGALDPLNDMFWTWNNGYVMFKLEGTSTSSKAVDNRIEHHIGGYKGPYKTMRKISLPIDPLAENGFVGNIIIRLDLDHYWKGQSNISLSELPVITLPGTTAAAVADNFSDMFSIKRICCYPL